MEEKSREEEIRKIWKDYRLFYKLLGAAALVGIGVLAGRWIYEGHDPWGYGINVFTSVISTVATVLIVNQYAERRADRKAEEVLKQQLIDDAASNVNDVASNAVHQLRRKRWLTGEDGVLWGKDLMGANLSKARMEYANLLGTDFTGANLNEAVFVRASLNHAKFGLAQLRKAILDDANLTEARLNCAKLSEALLKDTDLSGAYLENAVLDAADLSGANLRGANLTNAVLTKAILENAIFDESTILPDGSKWVRMPETDMRRFTDEWHPNYFQSNWWKIDNCEV